MVGVLTFLFIVLSMFLGLFVYIQQGKGDMGLGGIGGGTQTLFGGSGGQEFFERATWIMGTLFIFGALALSIIKTGSSESRLAGYQAPVTNSQQAPTPEQ